jgi:hypothetical protein
LSFFIYKINIRTYILVYTCTNVVQIYFRHSALQIKRLAWREKKDLKFSTLLWPNLYLEELSMVVDISFITLLLYMKKSLRTERNKWMEQRRKIERLTAWKKRWKLPVKIHSHIYTNSNNSMRWMLLFVEFKYYVIQHHHHHHRPCCWYCLLWYSLPNENENEVLLWM